MAGSYNHIVEEPSGKLLKPRLALSMLDCHHGDVYEALEEMYGMIWWLATTLSDTSSSLGGTPAEFVEAASENYTRGLLQSPGTDGVLPVDDDEEED